MKKLFALALMAIGLAACERMDYGQCLKGHEYDSSYIIYQTVGTMQIPMFIPQTSFACDVYEYPDGHGPNYRAE